MTCRRAGKDISRAIDGELSERRRARLERHLASCAECRALREDLRRIVEGSTRLGTPEPSDNVWRQIRAGLARESATAAGPRPADLRRPAFWLGAPVLRYAGIAAAALVLVAAGVLAGRRLGSGPEALDPEARERYTLAKLDEAESHYQQAIRALDEAFAAGKGELPAPVAEIFDRNLSVIDATIQACRRAVLEEPDDLAARNYLLAAYTRKITLLDSALELQRQGREAGRTKTVI